MYGNRTIEISGGAAVGHTNQTAELMAAIKALSRLSRKRRWSVLVRSDSAYLVNCFREGWIENWRRKGWRHKGGERPNRTLWETLEALVAFHDVEFEHVKGHSGDTYNERADRLAVAARERAVRLRNE